MSSFSAVALGLTTWKALGCQCTVLAQIRDVTMLNSIFVKVEMFQTKLEMEISFLDL